jgi:hypothetical protein
MNLKELKKLKNASIYYSINFPEAYDVSDPNQANQMELKTYAFGIKRLLILKF